MFESGEDKNEEEKVRFSKKIMKRGGFKNLNESPLPTMLQTRQSYLTIVSKISNKMGTRQTKEVR